MQRKHDIVAVLQMLVHVGDLHRVDVRHAHLNRDRQVNDSLALRGRLPDVEYRVADLQRIFRLRTREGLWRILEAIVCTRFFREFFEQLRAIHGQLPDAFLILFEYLLALRHGGGVVDVHDGIPDALQGIKGLADDVLAGLREHLYCHIVGDEVLLHQRAQEFILRFGGRGEPDFDLLEANRDELLVERQLFLQAHRHDERLIAVAQVDAAPDGRMLGRIFFRPVQIDLRRQEITFAVLPIIHHVAGLQ